MTSLCTIEFISWDLYFHTSLSNLHLKYKLYMLESYVLVGRSDTNAQRLAGWVSRKHNATLTIFESSFPVFGGPNRDKQMPRVLSLNAYSLQVKPKARSSPVLSASQQMSSSEMAVDRPAKIGVDAYLTTVLSVAPQDLHQYLEAFRTLHQRRSVIY